MLLTHLLLILCLFQTPLNLDLVVIVGQTLGYITVFDVVSLCWLILAMGNLL